MARPEPKALRQPFGRVAGAGLGLPMATLTGAMFSFQYGASLAKGLFPAVGAEGATALRIGLAAVMLGVVLRPWRARLTRANLPVLIGYGVSLGLMNLCFYMALRTIPLGVAVAVEFTGPLSVAVAGSRRLRDFACAGAAAIGILLLLPLGSGRQGVDLTGVLFALAAGACWAAYMLFGSRAGREHGTAAASLGMIVAAGVAVPVGLAHAGPALFSPAILPRALLVAVFSSALPYSLEMITLTRIRPRIYGVLTSMEPASAALLGFVLLHERLSPTQLLAIGAVMLASVGATLSTGAVAVPPE